MSHILRTALLAGVVLTCNAQSAASCTDADRAATEQIMETWKRSYNDGISQGIAALYAPDAVYMTQHFVEGLLQGREQIRAYFQLGIDARYQVESIKPLRTTCSGDMAWAVTRYDSTNAGVKAFGFNLVVLRKSANGRWWIVAHESAVPEPGGVTRARIDEVIRRLRAER